VAIIGLEAIAQISKGQSANQDWVAKSLKICAAAKQQGGRCELQIVSAMEALVRKAASKK
jgi:hypothetical protein